MGDVFPEALAERAAELGSRFVVKFAWSQAAAWRLVPEGAVLKPMAHNAPHLPVPELVACSADPALLLSTLGPGDRLTYHDVSELSGDRLDQLAAQLGGFLPELHRPDVLRAAEDAEIWLPAPRPQATTDALRHRFGALVDESRYRQVLRLVRLGGRCPRLSDPVVLLHGDFGGHNLVWDPGTASLRLVADPSSCGRGPSTFRWPANPTASGSSPSSGTTSLAAGGSSSA